MTGPASHARGVALILASDVVFCLMAGLIRWASDVNSFTVVMFRFAIGLGVLGIAALLGLIELRFVRGRYLLLRGLTGGTAVFLFFLSIAKLGIGKGTVISFSYPVFASVLGAVFLKERLGPAKCILVATALAGLAVLSLEGGGSSALLSVGVFELLGIAGAVCAGFAVVLIRKLHETDSTYAIFFAQCAVGLALVVVPGSAVGAPLGQATGVLLVGVGLAAAAGQLLMTEGFRHVTAATGSLLGMLLPVLSLLAGMLVFGEAVSPRGWIGSAVVIASCSLVILADRRPRAKPAASGP